MQPYINLLECVYIVGIFNPQLLNVVYLTYLTVVILYDGNIYV